MRIYSNIIGEGDNSDLTKQIHVLEHKNLVDSISLNNSDLSRRRFTCMTAFGNKIGISLPRSVKLYEGAILDVCDTYCLVVKVEPELWLCLQAVSPAVALRLGYFAGNLHWTVKFDENLLWVAIAGSLDGYINRVYNVFTHSEVKVIEETQNDRKQL